MVKQYSVESSFYVSEDNYIVEVESDEELEELQNDHREVESFTTIIPENVIAQIVKDHMQAGSKKVISKGYTIEVTSWENDGDHYATKSLTVPTLERAQALRHMFENLFKSSNNGCGGVGNLCDHEMGKYTAALVKYFESYPWVAEQLLEEETLKDHDTLCVIVGDLSYDFMGGSEWYLARVCERVSVYYSPNDITVKEITHATA